jgi:hypothetical protein
MKYLWRVMFIASVSACKDERGFFPSITVGAAAIHCDVKPVSKTF